MSGRSTRYCRASFGTQAYHGQTTLRVAVQHQDRLRLAPRIGEVIDPVMHVEMGEMCSWPSVASSSERYRWRSERVKLAALVVPRYTTGDTTESRPCICSSSTRSRVLRPRPRKIPVIDYGPYFAGEPDALQLLAERLRYACENIGFFYAINHGVPQETIDRGFAASRRFHALPLEEKLKLRLNQNNIGYMPMNASVQAASKVHKATKPNQNESFFISHDRGGGSSGRDGRRSAARPQPVARRCCRGCAMT